MTDTTELESQTGALRDAALLEMAEQEGLIENLRQQIAAAQAHHRSLEGEAKRLTRATLALNGSDTSDVRVETSIAQRRKALEQGAHIDSGPEPLVG